MRNVRRRLRVTVKLQVPLLSPVRVCGFQDARARNSSGSLHGVEKGKHLAELVRRIGRNSLCAVFRVERLQALVSEVPNLHMTDCSL
jgi:hypothetical protein